MELSGVEGWTIILTGGRLKPESLALVGDQTQQSLRRYHVDKAVMSCKGIDLESGVTDSSEFHSQTKQSMLCCAKKRILILDSSKFDKVSFIDIAPLDAFDTVVTNAVPSKAWLDYFADHNIRVPVSRYKIKEQRGRPILGGRVRSAQKRQNRTQLAGRCPALTRYI